MALERRRLAPGARRRQLIELGLEAMAAESREAVSLDRISEAAGISRGLLFHYFPSKREYHAAVVAAAAQRLLEATEPDPDLPLESRLHSALDAYLTFVEANEGLYRALVRGSAGGDPELRAIFDRTRDQLVSRAAAQLGAEASPALRLALRGWQAFVEEVALEWTRRRELERGSLVELMERAFYVAVEAATLGA